MLVIARAIFIFGKGGILLLFAGGPERGRAGVGKYWVSDLSRWYTPPYPPRPTSSAGEKPETKECLAALRAPWAGRLAKSPGPEVRRMAGGGITPRAS